MDLKAYIVGAPIIKLRIKANKPYGQIAVRLCDVAPDGTSSRITYGVLNLKFINGFEESRPVVLNKETVRSEFLFKTRKYGCFIPYPYISELIIEGVKNPEALFIPGSGVFKYGV